MSEKNTTVQLSGLRLRGWARTATIYATLLLVLTGATLWRTRAEGDAAPSSANASQTAATTEQSLATELFGLITPGATPAATAKAAATPEAPEGFFSLTANRTYPANGSPRVWLDYRNLESIDIRVYRMRDPAKFFRELEDKHQLGADEKEEAKALRPPSVLEFLGNWKSALVHRWRDYVRSQIAENTRRSLNRYLGRTGTAARQTLNQADYARVPLLNSDQMVSSWRERLPEKIADYDRRPIPLGKREAGVYLVEAVNGNLRAYTVAIVSDLVMISKSGPTGDLLVSTVNRTDGAPRAGANVEVVRNRQSLNGGTTDASGMWRVNVPKPPARPNPTNANSNANTPSDKYVVMAAQDSNFAISDLSPFGFQDEGDTSTLNLRSYIYTDRPVYRPTHKVYFKGILRDLQADGYKLLTQRTVNVTVTDEDDNKLFTRPLPLTPRGTFSGEVTIPATAKLGYYNVKATIGSEEAQGYFQVEEYKKPEYKVSVTTPQKFVSVGTKARFQVEARYFFGSPVTQAEVKYYIYRSRHYDYWWDEDEGDFGIEGASDDDYGPYYGGYNNETVKEGVGTTDAQGRLIVDFDIPPTDANKKGSWDDEYRLEAQVTDSSRNVIEGRGTVVAIRGNVRASVTAPRYTYRQGEKVSLVIRASDYERKPIATTVRLQFVERTWEKVKKKSEDGSYEYDDYEPREKNLDSATVNTSAQGETVYEYTVQTPGNILIKPFVRDTNGREIEADAESIWVGSGSDSGYYFSYPNYGSMTLIPDKKSYQPGDTAKVLVMLPTENANLLVTTELMNVMSARTIKARGRSVLIDVPIEAKHAPNFYLNISYVQDNELYTDSQTLIVPARDKILNLTLIPNKKEFQPRENVTYQVTARRQDGSPVAGAEVSVGVVDESIYSVRGDWDNIKGEFYGRRYNRVDTNLSDAFYFQGYAGTKPANLAQGPAKRPNNLADFKPDGSLVDPTIRKLFKDTAFWQPNVITGPDGTASVTFTLPDNLTTWRATARAVTANTEVGSTIDRVVERKAVIIRLATPRFVTAGDTVTLSGLVHNYLKTDKRAVVSLSINGGGQIVGGGATQNLNVKRDTDERANWQIKAPDTSGEMILLAKALTDVESDAVQIPLKVLPRGLQQSTGAATTYAQDEAQQEFSFDMPTDSDASARSLKLEAAPSVAGTLFGALDYLTGYPYGCTEQTMSRFLPSVIVAQALKDVKTARVESKEQLDLKVKRGLERLYGMQHDDGGWGWWKDDETNPFMTAYVVDGLTQAKSAGYDIDSTRQTRARARLKQMLDDDRKDGATKFDLDTYAYLTYAYIISGESEAVYLNNLAAQEGILSSYGRALLALALHERKDARAAQVAEKLASTARANANEAEWLKTWTNYRNEQQTGSDVETTALALKALSRIAPKNQLLPLAARWLTTHRRFGAYWDATRQTSFAISALTDYLKASNELQPDYTVEIYVNGALVLTQRATAENAAQAFVWESKGSQLAAANRVRIVKRGRGNLYFTGNLNYYAGTGDVTAASNGGLQVAREYRRLVVREENGKPKWALEPLSGALRSGDVIVSRLRLQGPKNARYLMLEDPIPAGAEQVYSANGINLDRTEKGWSDWYSSREFRDNRTVFFLDYFDGDASFQYAMRVINPGEFRLVPARAELMYEPDVKANTESGLLRIDEK